MAQAHLEAIDGGQTSARTNAQLRVAVSELTRSRAEVQHVLRAAKPSTGPHAAVEKVLTTPELLEMILENLGPLDLLQATQTSRATAAVVESSLRIHQAMFIGPNKSISVISLFPDEPIGFSIYYERFMQHSATLLATLGKFEKLPRLGQRARTMLVCQPPVKEAEISVECCRGFTGKAVEKINSDTGITFGELWDTTELLRAAHRLCPWAHEDLLDECGYAWPEVRFILAEVPCTESQWAKNNISGAQEETDVAQKEDSKTKEDLRERLEAYTMAKQQGKSGS